MTSATSTAGTPSQNMVDRSCLARKGGHSPRTEEDFDQVVPGLKLADKHAFGPREKLSDAHGNRTRSVVHDLVRIAGEGALQTFLDDFPWEMGEEWVVTESLRSSERAPRSGPVNTAYRTVLNITVSIPVAT